MISRWIVFQDMNFMISLRLFIKFFDSISTEFASTKTAYGCFSISSQISAKIRWNDQWSSWLFIVKLREQSTILATSTANHKCPRAKPDYQLSKLLGNEGKMLRRKNRWKQGIGGLGQVEMPQFSNSSLPFQQGGSGALIKLFGSPAWRRQESLMQEFVEMKIKKIVRS